MSNIKGFTATQMSVINEAVAKAVAEAIVATMQAMPSATETVPALPTPEVKLTLAQAKNQSITQRLARGVASVNNVIGSGGNWAADKLSTFEVNAVPAVVKTTGIMCAKSAFTAISISNTLSSFADRCAAARVRMEFAE